MLDKAFENILDRDDFEVDTDPSALAPERVLVFEIIGSPVNFVTAARKVGLEWLAEEIAILTGVQDYLAVTGEDDDEEEDEGDALLAELIGTIPDETPGRFYLGMPTIETFNKLKTLWDLFVADQPPPDKHSDWWALFASLHALRSWGPEDRLNEPTRERLLRQIAEGDEKIRVEIDLWYREEVEDRQSARTKLVQKIETLGGTLLDGFRFEAIRYHAALVELPRAVVADLVQGNTDLAIADEVMSIRPQSSFRFGIDEPDAVVTAAVQKPETPKGPAIAALIDGYPVENHALLKDRIDVLPVDVLESMAPVSKRLHGTAMASLILHGDLHTPSPTIGRTLKIVPVLKPDDDGYETPPPDKLALRTILRAVRELKSGLNDEDPSGPDVVIINHSICDEALAFCGMVSPWARMLDELSYQHKVLFIVSAGNIDEAFKLDAYATIPEFRTATVEERRQAILKALEAAKAKRGMLAPAEAVNCLTVGAVHHDGSTAVLPSNNVDPYGAYPMINLNSGLGLGFGRSIKPDLIVPGGRQIAHPAMVEGGLDVHGRAAHGVFGHSAATPDPHGGKTDLTRQSAGTSNAAALATRSGILIADALDEAYEGAETPWYRRPTAPCVLKALIAHGARWGPVGEDLDLLYPPAGKHSRRRENIARFLGYGQSNIAAIVSGGSHRVTLLAEDVIRTKQRHEYKIPLPDELSSKIEFRRITATLAWLSPIRPNSANYRAVGLELVGHDGKSGIWRGVGRIKTQPPVSTSRKGTLIHAIYENEGTAVPFDAGSDFTLNVQATSRLTGVSRADVPYALAVTIEVATTLQADIYTSIRNRVGPRVGVR